MPNGLPIPNLAKIDALTVAATDGSSVWQAPYQIGNNNMGGPHLLKPDGKTEVLVTAKGIAGPRCRHRHPIASWGAWPGPPSPAIADKHLFSTSIRGDVFISTIGRDAKPIGTMKMVDDCEHEDCPKSPDGAKRICKSTPRQAGPAFLGDVIVLRTHNNLWCSGRP
jgi:hypothetical protein